MKDYEVLNTLIPARHFKTAIKTLIWALCVTILPLGILLEFYGFTKGVSPFIFSNILLAILTYLATWNDYRRVHFTDKNLRIYFPLRFYKKETIINYSQITSINAGSGFVTGGNFIVFWYKSAQKTKKSWIYGRKEDQNIIKEVLITNYPHIRYTNY
jgi:hypothetical protein